MMAILSCCWITSYVAQVALLWRVLLIMINYEAPIVRCKKSRLAPIFVGFFVVCFVKLFLIHSRLYQWAFNIFNISFILFSICDTDSKTWFDNIFLEAGAVISVLWWAVEGRWKLFLEDFFQFILSQFSKKYFKLSEKHYLAMLPLHFYQTSQATSNCLRAQFLWKRI